MSATSDIESEDLENVPLVRMEDVQPDRYEEVKADALTIIYGVVVKDEVLETCVVDSVSSDYVVDNDRNLLVSIQRLDGESPEMILPDASTLHEPSKNEEVETKPNVEESKPDIRGSWPTLEILPGGVIKHAYPFDDELDALDPVDKKQKDSKEMMYVCAKCSHSFKCLFCLSKHVKCHKEHKCGDYSKITCTSKKYVCLHTGKRKFVPRCKTPKKS